MSTIRLTKGLRIEVFYDNKREGYHGIYSGILVKEVPDPKGKRKHKEWEVDWDNDPNEAPDR